MEGLGRCRDISLCARDYRTTTTSPRLHRPEHPQPPSIPYLLFLLFMLSFTCPSTSGRCGRR
jgi:hypothetical protein